MLCASSGADARVMSRTHGPKSPQLRFHDLAIIPRCWQDSAADCGQSLRTGPVNGFLNCAMTSYTIPRYVKLTPLVAFAVALGACLAGCWTSGSTAATSGDMVGEEHVVNYPAHDTFVMVQDVLRGEGILFDVEPEDKVVTLWMPADTPAGMWASLVGVRRRYRYEIQVVPISSHQSKIIANVRGEDIGEGEIDTYKASRRLDLFNKFDRLAAKYPPPPSTPTSGGVNFALLPGEGLPAFAKRVTGNADNWRQIAQDNGLKSPTDLAGVQSLWVRDSLMEHGAQPLPSPRR
jgi:hypothetical protein